MIVIESRLNEIFNQLPEIDGFKPVYKWGDEFHLIKQLQLYSDANRSIYPLIYQTSNGSKQDDYRKEATTSLNFVLACRNTEVDLTNEQRWEMSYKNILYPLVQNIVYSIIQSGIATFNGEYDIKEFPNYGDGKLNETNDIWDALTLDCSITLNANCVKTIYFNT